MEYSGMIEYMVLRNIFVPSFLCIVLSTFQVNFSRYEKYLSKNLQPYVHANQQPYEDLCEDCAASNTQIDSEHQESGNAASLNSTNFHNARPYEALCEDCAASNTQIDSEHRESRNASLNSTYFHNARPYEALCEDCAASNTQIDSEHRESRNASLNSTYLHKELAEKYRCLNFVYSKRFMNSRLVIYAAALAGSIALRFGADEWFTDNADEVALDALIGIYTTGVVASIDIGVLSCLNNLMKSKDPVIRSIEEPYP